MYSVPYSIQDEKQLIFLENSADLVTLPSVSFLVKILWSGELLVIWLSGVLKKLATAVT